MAGGERPIQQLTGVQNSAQAIVRGELCVQNDTAQEQNVIRSGANAAKPYGVCLEDSPGQGRPFLVGRKGRFKVRVGVGGCTQGAFVWSDAVGRGIDATAAAGRNVFGIWAETGVAGDLCLADIDPGNTTVT